VVNPTQNILAEVASIPRVDNEPVFREPWEAEAFAMVLTLHQAGLFSWSDWADELSGAIQRAQANGDADLGNTYYQHWLDALETIVVKQGLAEPAALQNLSTAWRAAAARTPHGEPIELYPSDLQAALK